MSLSTKMLAALVAMLILACGTQANGGARKLSAVNPCKVEITGRTTSYSQAAFSSAFTEAYDADIFKTFCSSGGVVPSQAVIAAAIAAARPAIASATSQAFTQICATGTILGSCSPGSWAAFSASATATAIARAVASSYANATASVIGQAAYSLVSGFMNTEAFALQDVCNQAFLSVTTNGKLTCSKASGTCPCTTRTCPCSPLTCVFSRTASLNVTSDASAQAIAKAYVKIMSTPGESVCTYEGNTQTCAQFTELCDAVCDPEVSICGGYPTVTMECEGQTGPWAMLSNNVYECQPYCPDGVVVEVGSHWVCQDPPPLPAEAMCDYNHHACDPADCPSATYWFTCLDGNGPDFNIFPSSVTKYYAPRPWVLTPIPPGPVVYQASSGVAFHFIAETTGTVTITTTGLTAGQCFTNSDTVLYLYDDNNGTPIQMAADDDSGADCASLIVDVVGDSAYTIYLASYVGGVPASGLAVALVPLA